MKAIWNLCEFWFQCVLTVKIACIEMKDKWSDSLEDNFIRSICEFWARVRKFNTSSHVYLHLYFSGIGSANAWRAKSQSNKTEIWKCVGSYAQKLVSSEVPGLVFAYGKLLLFTAAGRVTWAKRFHWDGLSLPWVVADILKIQYLDIKNVRKS